jgi:hypothetical protein
MMSLIAVIVLVIHLAVYGTARQADESTSAHLWQILIAGQVPFVAFFIIKCLRQAPRAAFPILMAQVAAALIAVAPVYFCKW